MDKHLCLPWKGVHQSSSIRGWHLFGRSESNICLMYVGTSLVDTLYKSSNKLVHLHPIITNITDFKGIIKVNMGCKKGVSDFNLQCQIYGVSHREVNFKKMVKICSLLTIKCWENWIWPITNYWALIKIGAM